MRVKQHTAKAPPGKVGALSLLSPVNADGTGRLGTADAHRTQPRRKTPWPPELIQAAKELGISPKRLMEQLSRERRKERSQLTPNGAEILRALTKRD